MWLLNHGAGVWRYALLDLFALVYFYVRWSSPEAQHRQFHFLLMWSYLITTAFYAYQFWVGSFASNAFGISPYWYQLTSNILFECELLLIIGYSFLFRRARRNKAKYRADVAQGFRTAGAVKKSVAGFLRGKASKPRKK